VSTTVEKGHDWLQKARERVMGPAPTEDRTELMLDVDPPGQGWEGDVEREKAKQRAVGEVGWARLE
jgi:hypothetical protein